MNDQGDRESVLHSLAEYLQVEYLDPNEVFGKPTMTFSGSRSRPDDYWSDEAEELYSSLGFKNLASLLGE